MTPTTETRIRPQAIAAYDAAMAEAAAVHGCATDDQVRAGWRAAYRAALIADQERDLLRCAATWRGVGMAPTAEVPDAPALRAAARWWGARFRVAADRARELAQ